MFELQTQVFKFRLDVEQTQAVGKGCVEIEGLVGDASLLELREGVERAHVVKSVGYFNDEHAHVFRHREQEVAEILGLFLRVLDGMMVLIGRFFGHEADVAA